MNNFQGIGRLIRDPETRAVGGGNVSNLTIAINRSWKDKKSGEWKEDTLFLKATAWAKLSDKAVTLKKGDLVLVAGHLESRKWQDKDGGNRESIELVAQTLESINAVKTGASSGGDDWKTKGKNQSPRDSFPSDLDDEIPF